ncbi:MAG: hypothetical protein KAR08_05885 [Candidatus Heimdallarchaeota archaeon]|nr:hypothetical protein [Candidatus Heimdallarchaeota archaeon]
MTLNPSEFLFSIDETLSIHKTLLSFITENYRRESQIVLQQVDVDGKVYCTIFIILPDSIENLDVLKAKLNEHNCNARGLGYDSTNKLTEYTIFTEGT